MKKFYTALCAMAAASMAFADGQQVPNGGFEEAWTDCKPWTSNKNSKTQGQTPESWCISNVIGTGTLGKTTVGEKTEGYNSDNAVKLFVGTTMGNNIPGYITLGTSWSTSTGTGSNKDGGTFGGKEWSSRPDALSFMYKRVKGSDTNNSAVIAYLWKGTYTQANVPGNIIVVGSTTKVNMENRDRNILDIETSQGGDITKSEGAERIAVINTSIADAAEDWTNFEFPFAYETESTPTMMNIIIAADDYFTTTPKKGNELTIDDVKYLYYSRLNEITVNGTAVADFAPDTYEYAIDAEMPANDAIAYTALGNSGTSAVAVNRDEANNTITLVCSNAQGEDKDGLSEHSYTLKFKAAETPEEPAGDAVTYDGTLTIDLSKAFNDPEQVINLTDQKLYITPTGEGKCTVSILNLKLDPTDDSSSIGDIIVPNISVKEENGVKSYDGTGHVALMDNVIEADAVISGTEDANGAIKLLINVSWASENDIVVTFNGAQEGTLGINGVELEENAPAEYYDMRGIRHNADSLAPGLYIKRQGSKATKVVVK